MDVVAIKVKIGLRANGHADHPDWTKLPMINSDSEVRQHCPSGWIYDKSCGHQEERINGDSWDSPKGMQWGCLLCTEQFADEAVAAYPDRIIKLTEIEFQDFYDNKALAHMPAKTYDIDILQGLKIELELKEKLLQDTTELKVKIAKALDENDNEPGVRKNKNRYWTDYSVQKGFVIPAVIEKL